MRSASHPEDGRNAAKSSSSILPSMSDPTPPPKKSVTSSAAAGATTADSASPQSSSKSASSTSAMAPSAAPAKESGYGTRSRNRTGASRPNYAETTDIDADLEMMQDKVVPRSGTASSSRKSDDNVGKQSAVNGNAKNQTHHNSHPSTPSSTSATGGAGSNTTTTTTAATANGASSTNSKKRKAGASSSSQTASQASQSQPSTPAHSTQQKRVGTTSQGANGAANASVNGNSPRKGYAHSNMLTFENSRAMSKDGKSLVADDGTVLSVNDHIYLVCEPPGEPYYLARIMEWVHVQNDTSRPVDSVRVNWYYRPKDIGRKVQDTRLVLATMHSDTCPLTSLRGKCTIKHKAEIADLTDYKRKPDCFWFERLYERYIQKHYEVIPTAQVVNVPDHIKKFLDQYWKFILVEQGRGKELTSARKRCIKCEMFCASHESVDCAVCRRTYHMYCVKPALQKKPSRGFAWSCAACSRAQERKLEARNTPNILDPNNHTEAEEEDFVEDEDEEPSKPDTGRTSPAEDEHQHKPPTEEQKYQASLWPYRYLGQHCKLEDALDLDDRVFPRASTRLGPRHQANVTPWPGRRVEYVQPLGIKKNRKDGKPTKESQAAIEAEKKRREKKPWIQDAPPGWIERGGDDTAQLMWKPPPEADMSGDAVVACLDKAQKLAPSLGLPARSTNLATVALYTLFETGYDEGKMLAKLRTFDVADFREPNLTSAEQKKFEEAVAKFGSELHSVKKHVKTVSAADIVRYYYTWKKTDKGKQIWGNYAGRKGKKDARKAEAAANKLADDVADDHDDSAFDTDKATSKKRQFMCKFCGTKNSRQWRRAPAFAMGGAGETSKSNKDKNGQYVQALCRRCAELWRRYAIQWEDVEEMAKKVAQTGGRGWRRKVDEELLKELMTAEEMANNTHHEPNPNTSVASISSVQDQPPPRKKLKSAQPDRDIDMTGSDSGSMSGLALANKKKEKVIEKPAPPPPPPPPPAPELPKARILPCAICLQKEPMGDQHLSCKECRMTVHRNCYGVMDNRAPGKWTCDMCLNDKAPQVSIRYKCVLCPIEYTEQDFVEPPKISHKKKTEKDRERERQERELAQKAADFYRKRQEDMNRPVNPREPLKRTADNNWVHVTCAVWTPEVKFGNAKALSPSEGIPSIPRQRYAETCKVCKMADGACVSCHQCKASLHVECAHQAGHVLGFELTPVKGSRRDQHNIVTIAGESGIMSAGIWCKDHAPTKTVVHRMQDAVDDSGINALQLYVQNFKQADLALTGCARKATQISLAAKNVTTPTPVTVTPSAAKRRDSMVNGDHKDAVEISAPASGKVCCTCGTDISLRWHTIEQSQERGLVNGQFVNHYHSNHGKIGEEAQKFVDQRKWQCHKCRKTGRKLEVEEPKPAQKESTRPVANGETAQNRPPPLAQVNGNTGAATNGNVHVNGTVNGNHGPTVNGTPLTSPTTVEPRPYQQYPAWSPEYQGARPSGASVPGPSAPAVQPLPLQAPAGPVQPSGVVGVQQLLSPVQPPSGPRGNMRPQNPPPMQAPQTAYAPPGPAGSHEWYRPSTASGPAPPPLRDPLRDPLPLSREPIPPMAPQLRPPPLSVMGGQAPPPPPLSNGYVSQQPAQPQQPPPYANGVPQSPRRLSGPPPPPMQNGPPVPVAVPAGMPVSTYHPSLGVITVHPNQQHAPPPPAPVHAPEVPHQPNYLRSWSNPPPQPQHPSPIMSHPVPPPAPHLFASPPMPSARETSLPATLSQPQPQPQSQASPPEIRWSAARRSQPSRAPPRSPSRSPPPRFPAPRRSQMSIESRGRSRSRSPPRWNAQPRRSQPSIVPPRSRSRSRPRWNAQPRRSQPMIWRSPSRSPPPRPSESKGNVMKPARYPRSRSPDVYRTRHSHGGDSSYRQRSPQASGATSTQQQSTTATTTTTQQQPPSGASASPSLRNLLS